MRYDAEAERQMWAWANRRHFWTFLNYGFGVKPYMDEHPEDRWCTERLHRPLCDWFEDRVREWLRTRAKRTRKMKLMIIWPRGHGKTTTLTKAGNIWLHLQAPDLSTVIDSVTYRKSEEFLGTVRETLDGANQYAWFTRLYGNWRGKIWRGGAIVHNRRQAHARSDYSFEASSVEVGITGKHVDAIFVDDPIVKEKLREGDNWFQRVDEHIDALIPAVKTNGLFVACATRYADIDWLGRLMRDEGVRAVYGMVPRDPLFETRTDGQWELYFMRARREDGSPVLPEVWPREALDDYEKKNPMEFSSQMMNEPGEGEHMPLTRGQIDLMVIDKHEVPRNLRYSIHLDTAFKSSERLGRGDFSVIQVWGHEPKTGIVYYVEGKRSNAWRAEQFVDELVAIIQRYRRDNKKIFVITDEQTIGGKRGMAELYIMGACHAAGVPLPPFKALARNNTKKELRIREAAGYWADGRVRLLRGAQGLEHLISEMLRIGVSANDDMADAAADVFHPDVYQPESRLGDGVYQIRITRPWDDVLRTGPITNQEARLVYDEYQERPRDEEEPAPWAYN